MHTHISSCSIIKFVNSLLIDIIFVKQPLQFIPRYWSNSGILYKVDPDPDLDLQKKWTPDLLEKADPIPKFTV